MQVARLLLRQGADVNARDLLGRSAVFVACREQRDRLFDYFLDAHALALDLRLRDSDGNVLLNYVAQHGSTRMLRRIIRVMHERKIELDQRNNAGYSALLLSLKYDRFLNAYTLITGDGGKDDGNHGNRYQELQYQQGPGCSISLKDDEKHMNALEWLLVRIEANRHVFSRAHKYGNQNRGNQLLSQENLNAADGFPSENTR